MLRFRLRCRNVALGIFDLLAFCSPRIFFPFLTTWGFNGNRGAKEVLKLNCQSETVCEVSVELIFQGEMGFGVCFALSFQREQVEMGCNVSFEVSFQREMGCGVSFELN